MALIGALGLIGAVVAAGFFFGGFYSVAGTAYEPEIVKSVLVRVRTASIARHAKDPAPANLEEPATIQAGARQYVAQGCTTCHGGPGAAWAKFSEGMHPDPPDLKEVVGDRTPSELFWVNQNGINMTGMPSFALAGAKDDELWQIVAFLKRLPNVSKRTSRPGPQGTTKP